MQKVQWRLRYGAYLPTSGKSCARALTADQRMFGTSLYIKLRLFLAILARGHENLVQALGRYGGSVGVVTVDIEGLDLEQTSEKF